MGKYSALAEFLRQTDEPTVSLSCSEIEALIGAPLPPTAAWQWLQWLDDQSAADIADAWRRAGFRADQVNVSGQTIVLRRVEASDASEESTPTVVYSPIHPLYGLMKGMMWVDPDYDLTLPADPDWGPSTGDPKLHQ